MLKIEAEYPAQIVIEDYFIDLRGDFSQTDFQPDLQNHLSEFKQENGARGLMPVDYEDY